MKEMEPAHELQELNPYYNPEMEGPDQADKMTWRSQWEIEEWAYEQGYECGIDPLWEYFTNDMFTELGKEYLREGPECAREYINEHVSETVNTTLDEYLSSYEDGQMRLYAGYRVAENGDTLEEGDYGTYQDLRTCWEAGFRDRLRENEKYSSID